MGVVFLILFTSPSNDHEWNDDQSILPSAIIDGNLVTISNIRNFSYNSTSEYITAYYDKSFDLSRIKYVWYIVEPFDGIPGSAHTLLSFEFENDSYVSISIEIRKKKGAKFRPIMSLFNQYEIMYVVADERDVIKLRTNYRKDLVYMYKTTATKEKTKELFLDMLKRVNKLYSHPEFYNTLTNNCTSNIIKHINTISPKRISPFCYESVFPEYSDKLAYHLGLLDTSLSFEELRRINLINERAMQYADDIDFSEKIRER